MQEINVSTSSKNEFIDITTKIEKNIPRDYSGSILVYVPHTTAGITVNEGADPAVQSDVLGFLGRLVPWNSSEFEHKEGNSAAHIKAILVGNDQHLIANDGKLSLGTWEKLFLCEFDGPRKRKIWVKF